MKALSVMFLSLLLNACSFKSPVHSKMNGIYKFTYPTPYLVATFGRKGASDIPEYPYSVIEHEISPDFAPFEKPTFTEIREPLRVKVEYFLYVYAIDSGVEEYLVTETATGRGIRIHADLGKYLIKD